MSRIQATLWGFGSNGLAASVILPFSWFVRQIFIDHILQVNPTFVRIALLKFKIHLSK